MCVTLPCTVWRRSSVAAAGERAVVSRRAATRFRSLAAAARPSSQSTSRMVAAWQLITMPFAGTQPGAAARRGGKATGIDASGERQVRALRLP